MSISKCAEQPLGRCLMAKVYQVYPRECGAAKGEIYGFLGPNGLSPRVRGSRDAIISGKNVLGSIPASAGQPNWRGRERPWSGVYPRECGAAVNLGGCYDNSKGLSPRVRGSLAPLRIYAATERSIPASAG